MEIDTVGLAPEMEQVGSVVENILTLPAFGKYSGTVRIMRPSPLIRVSGFTVIVRAVFYAPTTMLEERSVTVREDA